MTTETMLFKKHQWTNLYFRYNLMYLIRTRRYHQLKHTQQLSSILRRNYQLKLYQQIPFQQHSRKELSELYKSLKKNAYEKEFELNTVSRGDVFVNNELNLRDMNLFGFNYDYTLAMYAVELQGTIYKIAVNKLIKECGYPLEIDDYKYDSTFVIRGLHFDMKNGYLMKISSMNRVQLGSVFRGYRKISNEEVLE